MMIKILIGNIVSLVDILNYHISELYFSNLITILFIGINETDSLNSKCYISKSSATRKQYQNFGDSEE